ncbi:MAG: hypothetical protein H0U49_05375, partial [Parachlamydiaceae bacterium]|nr:hypothetical protein [Parachlamydiaceae bacterium]
MSPLFAKAANVIGNVVVNSLEVGAVVGVVSGAAFNHAKHVVIGGVFGLAMGAAGNLCLYQDQNISIINA